MGVLHITHSRTMERSVVLAMVESFAPWKVYFLKMTLFTVTRGGFANPLTTRKIFIFVH